jgi:hypothetical protein
MESDPVSVMVITWRNHDHGGIATFEYAEGPVTSRPMSEASARAAADQAFGADHVVAVLDGGFRWSRTIPSGGVSADIRS